MQVRKPIFIIGSGRSGTTILYKSLCLHPDLCWFSNMVNSHPDYPELAFINRLTDTPWIGPRLKHSIINNTSPFFISPTEGETIYDYCGFHDGQKMTISGFPKPVGSKFKHILNVQLLVTGKKRFINKRTANTQRLDVIHAMFPDAYFIHVIRDGRAVANSLLHVPWWNTLPIWWLNGKTPNDWALQGKNPLELCALHWKHNIEEIVRHKKMFGKHYMEIRYEDFVSDVRGTIGTIMMFCQLPPAASYTYSLPQTFPNLNNKWKRDLTATQKTIVHKSVGPFLRNLGYG
jgi:hypothetical protein